VFLLPKNHANTDRRCLPPAIASHGEGKRRRALDVYRGNGCEFSISLHCLFGNLVAVIVKSGRGFKSEV